ncbi:ubiquitin c-terminal hydrolase [Grosmannia clavigera kw1407]|uniref:ubiquitinyl hydrolase 1 n=1 Tax=Grosmannia clavigera (strain kw1407 / UAMH 11150) TaxID=655863 RepID=F0XIM6_GROCL|nr:ubiquitin c-terminal hydrolase [Grosmannia clavigera kw1407]EFX02509.1 ubiquitin c-terminal hydrolase [Grosmannia clavigera kw1407]
MSSHDAWQIMTGKPKLRTFYETTYWDRLAEHSFIVPFIVLLVTIAFTTNIIEPVRYLLPSATGERLWDLLVSATPSSVLFAVDDWLNPFPTLRPPVDRASKAALKEAKSSALGRLLRKDKAGSIIASVSYAGRSGLSRLMPKGGVDRPAGLGNISNSCYQNSILQALSALAPLRDYLSWIAEEEETGGLPHASKLTWAPPYGEPRSSSPEQRGQWLLKRIVHLETGRRCSFLVSASHAKALWPIEYAVENIEGVQCASCTLLTFRKRIRVIIGRLEAESSSSYCAKSNQPLIYERLEAIEAALEEEDFEEKTLSDTCKIPNKQRVESTKSPEVGIARAPPSIAFHINRSRFDESTGYTFKNPAAIQFPSQLDLGPWCLGSAASRSYEISVEHESGLKEPDVDKKDNRIHQQRSDQEQYSPSFSSVPSLMTDNSSTLEDEEQWQLPPQLPMVSGTQYPSKITGPLYELRAVITHYGQHENGHYVCYRKHPAPHRPSDEEVEPEKGRDRKTPGFASEADAVVDGTSDEATDEPSTTEKLEPLEDDHNTSESQWWRLSDQNVTLSDETTVLSQGGVFMLFYDRIDNRSNFTSSAAHSTRSSEDFSVADADIDRAPILSTDGEKENAGDDTCDIAPHQVAGYIAEERETKSINYDLPEAKLAEAPAAFVHASLEG